jgi:hypothetical protein
LIESWVELNIFRELLNFPAHRTSAWSRLAMS